MEAFEESWSTKMSMAIRQYSSYKPMGALQFEKYMKPYQLTNSSIRMIDKCLNNI